MKTIREIAEEIGVTKQAIFYQMKKPPLSNTLRGLVSKENGLLTVSFDGEKLIKQAFSSDVPSKTPSKGNGFLAGAFDGEKLIKQGFNPDVPSKTPSKENTFFDGAFDGHTLKILLNIIDNLTRQNVELTATIKTMTESNKPKKVYTKKKLTAKAKSAPFERLLKQGK